MDYIDQDGNKFWYKDDLLHRLDGPACEYANGDMTWFKDDMLHREDGPACDWSHSKRYALNDKFVYCRSNEENSKYPVKNR